MPTVPASSRFLILAIAIAFLAQVALYWPTLWQLPFGDDWGPPLTEVMRGERVGWIPFFTETRQPDSYRPLQSLLIWLFGRVDEPTRWMGIRVLHFLSSGAAFVVLGLLLRLWKFGKPGVVVGAAAMAVHPTLVAPIGSIDGFSSVLSCAAVWWGVWMMWLAKEKPAIGIALACVAMIVGTLVKEYAFAMAPTAVLVAWMVYKPRWRQAVVTAAALGALTFMLLWMRQFVKPTDMEYGDDFAFETIPMLAKNAVLILLGGFFFGDSLWPFVTRSALATAVSGVILMLTLWLLARGIQFATAVGATLASPDETTRNPRATQASPLLLFLLLSIPAVTFPANLVMRISEMYLVGMVFTVALLAAIAADGWANAPVSRTHKRAACGFAALIALVAAVSVWHKMHAMIGVGDRTAIQVAGIREAATDLPDAGGTIALLYRRDQVPVRATFSSFRLPDYLCVRPPAKDYLFPGGTITILCPENPNEQPDAPVHLLPDEAAVRAWDRSRADIVLYWDVAAKRFERLK